MKAIVGIFQANVIRLKDGNRPPFSLFAQEIGNIFGITINRPHNEMQKVLRRKRDQTPFFNRIIDSMKNKDVKKMV